MAFQRAKTMPRFIVSSPRSPLPLPLSLLPAASTVNRFQLFFLSPPLGRFRSRFRELRFGDFEFDPISRKEKNKFCVGFIYTSSKSRWGIDWRKNLLERNSARTDSSSSFESVSFFCPTPSISFLVRWLDYLLDGLLYRPVGKSPDS